MPNTSEKILVRVKNSSLYPYLFFKLKLMKEGTQMSDLHDTLSDAELEQLIISIIQTENDNLSKRIYGNLRKELLSMKNELLKELKK